MHLPVCIQRAVCTRAYNQMALDTFCGIRLVCWQFVNILIMPCSQRPFCAKAKGGGGGGGGGGGRGPPAATVGEGESSPE